MELFLFFVLVVPAVLFRGFVLLNLWTWFIIPLGAPVITMAHALGISLLLGFMTSHVDSKEKSSKEIVQDCIMMFVYPAFALLLGWIFQSYM